MRLCQVKHTTASTGNCSMKGNHSFFDQLAKNKKIKKLSAHVSHHLEYCSNEHKLPDWQRHNYKFCPCNTHLQGGRRAGNKEDLKQLQSDLQLVLGSNQLSFRAPSVWSQALNDSNSWSVLSFLSQSFFFFPKPYSNRF